MERRSLLPKSVLLLTLALAVGGFARVAWGQTVTGTIVGAVTDPTGAVIPGVRVVVTNEATKAAHEVTTNEAGQYVVTFLPPGKYTVTAEQKGFKKKEISGLIVEVDQRVNADLALEVGEMTQVVHVEGTAPLLNTESSEVGQVIENKKVVDLPLNGRQFMELAFLVPAVHASAPGHFNEILQGFAATGAGGRPTNNNFTLDGVDNVSPNCGYFSVSPSVDAVQEFKIETSNYSAEFGRTGGLIVNVATKSGTNQLHGSLFEFIRNDALGDARNLFNLVDRNGDGKADAEQIRRHQFGGSVGGPVVIPGVYNGKNRTFFFYNEEHLRERKPRVGLGLIPSQAIRTGDFSKAGYTIFDPLTICGRLGNPACAVDPTTGKEIIMRQPFARNVIPTSRLSQAALNALKFYPPDSSPGNPGTTRDFINLEPKKSDTFQTIARVDHQISSKDSFFARFGESKSSVIVPGTLPNNFVDDLSFSGVNAAANWVHTFSPTLVNEFRAGYNRLNFARATPRSGTDFGSKLGIKGIPATRLSTFPIFSISGFDGLGDIEPYGNIDNIYQLVDMLSYTKGHHSMKFGVDIRRIQNDYFIIREPSGFYSLSGTYSSDKPGDFLPDGLADFLLGVPDSSFITYTGDIGRTRTTNWNAFFQDDWKVTPNLTVNLGLRYELFTPPKDKFGRQGVMDPATGEVLYVKNAPLDNPIPGSAITEADLFFPHRRLDRDHLIIGDNNNFAPRVGFAYKVPFISNTVVRGGYGVSYVYFPFSDIGVNTQRLLPFAIRPSFIGDFNFPTLGYDFDIGGARAVLLSRARFRIAGLDPRLHWGDVQQYSFNIQHKFKGNWVFDVGYLGNSARHLAQRWPTNNPLTPSTRNVQSRRPYPIYDSVTQVQSDINNWYNALTVRLEKRFSKGYGILTSYTWSKALGYGSEVYGTPGQESGTQNPLNRRLDRGLSPDDVRHRLVISYNWELPFGKGQRFGGNLPRGANFMASGWQINSITAFQSGFHTSATGGARTNMGWSTRPDQICNPNSGFTFSVNQSFNTACFAKPAPLDPTGLNPDLKGLTLFGTAPRNSIATHPSYNVDFSIMKNNKIGERLNVQFRWEMFNLPNHPNFATYYALPFRNFNSKSTFGRITAASDPRLMQVALKLLF